MAEETLMTEVYIDFNYAVHLFTSEVLIWFIVVGQDGIHVPNNFKILMWFWGARKFIELG